MRALFAIWRRESSRLHRRYPQRSYEAPSARAHPPARRPPRPPSAPVGRTAPRRKTRLPSRRRVSRGRHPTTWEKPTSSSPHLHQRLSEEKGWLNFGPRNRVPKISHFLHLERCTEAPSTHHAFGTAPAPKCPGRRRPRKPRRPEHHGRPDGGAPPPPRPSRDDEEYRIVRRPPRSVETRGVSKGWPNFRSPYEIPMIAPFGASKS